MRTHRRLARRGVALCGFAVLSCWGPLSGAETMRLSEALERALAYDPDYANAVASYEADIELAPQERAALKPSVTLNGSGSYARTESDGLFGQTKDEYPSGSVSLTARQALFRLDWFAIGDRAGARTRLAEGGLDDRRQQLLRKVAERYFNVLAAEDALAQARAEADAVRRSLEDTRRRYEVELVPGTDLKEAQARDDLAQAALAGARRDLDSARDALDETTGNGQAGLPRLPPDISFPPLSPASVDEWLAAARANSPAARNAEQQVVVARADLAGRKAEAAPTLDLVGQVGRDDNSEYAFGQIQDDARVTLELEVPLYAGGAVRAALREYEARVRAAEANLQRVRHETERQTRQSFRDVQTGYVEAQAYERALESAIAAEQATTYGYEAGTRTITDVLDAQSRRVQAIRNLNQTRYGLLLDLVTLKQTVGQLSARDFTEIDAWLSTATTPGGSPRQAD